MLNISINNGLQVPTTQIQHKYSFTNSVQTVLAMKINGILSDVSIRITETKSVKIIIKIRHDTIQIFTFMAMS
jgi:hypothetical protein